MIGRTLEGRPHSARSVDGGGGGLRGLACLLAQLAAEGRPVRLEAWERGGVGEAPSRGDETPPRLVIPLSGANLRGAKKEMEMSERGPQPTAVPSKAEAPAAGAGVGASLPAPTPLPTPATAWVSEALRTAQEGLRALSALQEQAAAAHQRFLDGQSELQRSYRTLLEGQQRLLAMAMGGGPLPGEGEAGRAPTRVAAGASDSVLPPPPTAPSAGDSLLPPPRTAASAGEGDSDPVEVLLAVVAEATGYPRSMLDLDMDLESDLGIDSIKRVEILSLFSERFPGAPAVEPERLGMLRTLRQVAAFVGSGAASPAAPAVTGTPRPAEAPQHAEAPPGTEAPPGKGLLATLRAVVSELTGYPAEMLDLDADLESDLGVDSIKRVEILSLLSERVPDAPALEPEQVSGLRTLRQVADFVGKTSSARAPAPAASRSKELGPAAPAPPPPSTPATLDAPLPPPAPLRFAVVARASLALPSRAAEPPKTWLLLDDGSPLLLALAAGLEAAGCAVRRTPPPEPGVALEPHVLLGVEALLLTGRGPQGGPLRDGPELDARVAAAFALLRQAAPALRKAAAAGRGLVVSLTRIDGALGFLGAPPAGADPAGLAALGGLAKSAAREWPGLRAAVLDADPRLDDETASARVLDELLSSCNGEVGLAAGGRRFVPSLEARPLPPLPVGAAPAGLREGDLVLVSGGARGVTAACAIALAEAAAAASTPLSFVLLGRSAEPQDEPEWLAGASGEAGIKRALLQSAFPGRRPSPREVGEACERVLAAREIRATLSRLKTLGATASYRPVDVRDAAAVRACVAEAQAAHGPVRALLHGAGVLRDRRIEDKSDAAFAEVWDTKVLGLRALLAALAPVELRALLVFTSVSGRFGRRGQADYAAANEALARGAQDLARSLPGCAVRALDWGPWEGGMVSPALAQQFAREGLGLLPLKDGAAQLVRELNRRGGAAEVVVGSALGLLPEELRGARSAGAAAGLAVRHRLDPSRDLWLDAHRLHGKPVVPLAMMMEWFAAAACAAAPDLALLWVEDLQLLQGVVLDAEPQDVEVRVVAEESADGALIPGRLRMAATLSSASGRVHARGSVVLGERQAQAAGGAAGTEAPRPAPARTAASRSLDPYPMDVDSAYEQRLFHGEPLRAITAIEGSSPSAMALRLRSAPPPGDWGIEAAGNAFRCDPLLADGIFQAMVLWAWEQQGAPSLPARVERWEQFVDRPPAGELSCEIAVRGGSRTPVFDAELRDGEGRLVARLLGGRCTVSAGLEAAFRRVPKNGSGPPKDNGAAVPLSASGT
jgi:acyl carrier protein